MDSGHGGTPPADSANANEEVTGRSISGSRRSRGVEDPPNSHQAAAAHIVRRTSPDPTEVTAE